MALTVNGSTVAAVIAAVCAGAALAVVFSLTWVERGLVAAATVVLVVIAVTTVFFTVGTLLQRYVRR